MTGVDAMQKCPKITHRSDSLRFQLINAASVDSLNLHVPRPGVCMDYAGDANIYILANRP